MASDVRSTNARIDAIKDHTRTWKGFVEIRIDVHGLAIHSTGVSSTELLVR